MYLKKVFIRFYKSFNDDFLRKNNERVIPKPWETLDDAFYPYIEVLIEKKITTVVGANESGKSHLLSAIEKAISGEGIERSDFCRYSPFFTVKNDEMKYPDFGFQISLDKNSSHETEEIKSILNIPENIDLDSFLVFRNNCSSLQVYTIDKGKYVHCKINKEKLKKLQDLFPNVLKIESNIALPSSVSIQKLIEIQSDNFNFYDRDNKSFEYLDREQRNKVIEKLDKAIESGISVVEISPSSKESIQGKSVQHLASIVKEFQETGISQAEKERKNKQIKLAYKLICKIAQVDIKALKDLFDAIREGKQGYANGIIDQINRQLAINLNFPNYWVQDRKFSLKVMARDYDLVFTITDRTGTEYSFDERSQGLRYFLSYYIQYRSHEPHPSKSEILLMDEPDAYLSSQAQQDLLNVFDLFANPIKGSHLIRPIQVVYVTHSPFLIDKNHAERIRVLQKGNDDEGTRVVKDAAKNHYEPLRSSIGTYVGETAFIGNCNLMVEGLTDQILIAGATTFLRRKGITTLETLDLNQITIVPSGSAPHIPYLVYLARGRDVEQPAVIVLLDSDPSGNDAVKQLLGKGGQHRRPLLKKEFILQIGDNDIREEFNLFLPSKVQDTNLRLEIEDLIPISISIEAVKLYLREFTKKDTTLLDNFSLQELEAINGKNSLDCIQTWVKQKFSDESLSINKVGFVRNVILIVNDWSQETDLSKMQPEQSKALEDFEHNFRVLFKRLNKMQRKAQQKLYEQKLSAKIERIKKEFISLYPLEAKREDAVIWLDKIENIIEYHQNQESAKELEAVTKALQNLRRNYNLDRDLTQNVANYSEFKKGFEKLKYAGLIASQEQETDIQEV